MASISPELIERYQIELEKNPASRVFAPLAEAYRKMGLLDEAFRICSKGVHRHPDFASGRVAFARVLLERKEPEKALTQLERATQLSPDNLMAQSLLADTLLELRRPKDALKAYKMVLYLNPNDERALKAVRKWEFLSADEYDDELFKMRPVFQSSADAAPLLEPLSSKRESASESATGPGWRTREIERAVSLADALTVRGDLDRAIAILQQALAQLGEAPEVERRLQLLSRKTRAMTESDGDDPTPGPDERTRRLRKLETFLRRINERRAEG